MIHLGIDSEGGSGAAAAGAPNDPGGRHDPERRRKDSEKSNFRLHGLLGPDQIPKNVNG
jgi:hypothetical protein